ncbi:C40 family peptidase [Streptomyces massasporeus]|uniref:C40 family peptidase n=1 Tax=Streptomyces massasporeus TaxID=67324 RepID=UPI0037135023
MARGEDIVGTLRSALGVQYQWGGTSMSGFDCSGLVYWAFRQHGIELPRVTYNQINVGASVPPNKLRPGDLVFFDTDRKRTGPDHVGVYVGGGKFIHAARTGQPVKISSLAEGYYMDRWMGGRRGSRRRTGYRRCRADARAQRRVALVGRPGGPNGGHGAGGLQFVQGLLQLVRGAAAHHEEGRLLRGERKGEAVVVRIVRDLGVRRTITGVPTLGLNVNINSVRGVGQLILTLVAYAVGQVPAALTAGTAIAVGQRHCVPWTAREWAAPSTSEPNGAPQNRQNH